MPSAYEERIKRLEARIQPWLDQIRQLKDQLAQVKQQQYGQPTFGDSGGGGGGGIFFADHLSIPACVGLLSALPTPPSISGVSVYQTMGGGAFTLVTSSGLVANGLPNATDPGKRQILAKQSDGSYVVVTQSCSSP